MCPINLVGFDLDDCLFDSTGLSERARIKGIEAMIDLGLKINRQEAFDHYQRGLSLFQHLKGEDEVKKFLNETYLFAALFSIDMFNYFYNCFFNFFIAYYICLFIKKLKYILLDIVCTYI